MQQIPAGVQLAFIYNASSAGAEKGDAGTALKTRTGAKALRPAPAQNEREQVTLEVSRQDPDPDQDEDSSAPKLRPPADDPAKSRPKA